MNSVLPSEGAKRITFLLGRLTVLRGLLRTAPVVKLCELCDAIAEGDASSATLKYHAMTSALLEQSTRRVSGDIWKDFVFSEMLESPNRFSVLAAEGHMDPPVRLSMAHDLKLMQELFNIDSPTVSQWIARLCKDNGVNILKTPPPKPFLPERAKPKGPSDNETISRMASSAWSGGTFIRERQKQRTPEPQELPELPKELELENWAKWSYDEPGERIEYVADEGLAIIYRRFLAESDWGTLAQPLVEFHAKYGCGEFLRYRVFIAADDGLQGISDADAPDWDSLSGLSKQKEKIYANTLRFLHTGKGENVLLYGADGMGKSSLVLSLTKELPELRLILLAQRDFASSMETLRSLLGQPFRIIAFMDDLALSEREYRRLKAALTVRHGKSNALIYATSPTPPVDGSVFGLEIPFSMPDFHEFSTMVDDIVRRESPSASHEAVRSACVQWQGEKEDFSIRAAKRIAQNVLRQMRR